MCSNLWFYILDRYFGTNSNRLGTSSPIILEAFLKVSDTTSSFWKLWSSRMIRNIIFIFCFTKSKTLYRTAVYVQMINKRDKNKKKKRRSKTWTWNYNRKWLIIPYSLLGDYETIENIEAPCERRQEIRGGVFVPSLILAVSLDCPASESCCSPWSSCPS